MAKRDDSGSIGRIFNILLITLLVGSLGAAVLYLASDRNHRRYRLASHGELLRVERGRFLPVGFEPFLPDSESLQEAYAPVRVPDGERVTSTEVFDDRIDLDRALFALLAGWARARIDSPDPQIFELAVSYITRCESLPGLSEEQRTELRRLRGNLAFRNGVRMLESVEQLLRSALVEFRLAVQLESPRAEQARAWISELERRIAEGAAAAGPSAPARNLTLGDPEGDAGEKPSPSPLPTPPSHTPQTPGTAAPQDSAPTNPSSRWRL